ncbi:MAG: hypothetical protein EHM49_02075 [Deltaproteobacteria bacterium]|nr:MAG: hypothetical protein EHM49_02075 [Deltaproteobacteria bacterium]
MLDLNFILKIFSMKVHRVHYFTIKNTETGAISIFRISRPKSEQLVVFTFNNKKGKFKFSGYFSAVHKEYKTPTPSIGRWAFRHGLVGTLSVAEIEQPWRPLGTCNLLQAMKLPQKYPQYTFV